MSVSSATDFLSRLEITQFRNLREVKINPSKSINVFYGMNGSGKTSLLEAIYHLGIGRSFRTHLCNKIIQENKECFTVFGKISEIPVGIEKNRRGDIKIKYAMSELQSIASLAQSLPMQLIDPHCHLLINGGPKIKRQFIDWGVFHVEHDSFLVNWRKFQKIIMQRNSALKRDNTGREAVVWNNELVAKTRIIDLLRKNYMNQYSRLFFEVQKRLLNIGEITFEYYPGWYNDGADFETILEKSLERDVRQGFTHYGPHRADIKILVNKRAVDEILSRGEQKILASVMKISQAILLKEQTGKNCIFLIDDLPSELDHNMRHVLADELVKMNAQIFVTGIDRECLCDLFNRQDIKMFHVEHGQVIKEEA